jgi:hypothetical protein
MGGMKEGASQFHAVFVLESWNSSWKNYLASKAGDVCVSVSRLLVDMISLYALNTALAGMPLPIEGLEDIS